MCRKESQWRAAVMMGMSLQVHVHVHDVLRASVLRLHLLSRSDLAWIRGHLFWGAW